MNNSLTNTNAPKFLPQTNASTDEQFIEVWLANRPDTTARVYRGAVKQFLLFVDKSIKAIVLEDLQAWCASLSGAYKATTIKNKVSYVKSMLSFALRVGYVSFNVGAAVSPKKPWNELSQRIVNKDAIVKLIAAGKTKRDRLLMECLYILGLRISELHQLNWEDFRVRPDGSAIATIKGKGSKTRFVNIPSSLYSKLCSLQKDKPWVFSNYRSERLSTRSINRIIKAAAAKAGVTEKISAHWLRHAHASHSLDAGCDLPLLQQSLGHSSLAVTQVYLHINPERSSSQFLTL